MSQPNSDQAIKSIRMVSTGTGEQHKEHRDGLVLFDNGMAIHYRHLSEAVFFLGFAVLACHELDAVAQSEWRLLPILGALPDNVSYNAFIVGHIPIFAVLVWLVGHQSPTVRWRSRLGLDLFLVFHAGLHWLMSDHALYAFETPLSIGLIYGGGAIGLLHMAVETVAARKKLPY